MNKFMDEKFLITNKTGFKLYKQVKDLPIFDYHCHLNPQEIYENKHFNNLTELWLEGDHYKWRVMRNAGIPEELITGKADPYEKFYAFASVLPNFAGNPVYHWAHLELKKYFGITTPLSKATAKEIWDKTLEMMKSDKYSARELIASSNVNTIYTTDEPASMLEYHIKLANEEKRFTVLPSFRPDKAINIEKNEFDDYVAQLSCSSGIYIRSYDDLIAAIRSRIQFFAEHKCVIADISFTDFPKGKGDTQIAAKVFKAASTNAINEITAEELAEYKYCMIKELIMLCSEFDMALQIHTGVLRNVNTTRFGKLGADTGIDSIADAINIENAGLLFDDVERSGKDGHGLPRIIVYTLNPNSYYPLATMIGDFAGETPGRMQLGAAWWFMDHRDGIQEQLKILANTGSIGYFNGMLTDSRSFTSYARHDYFRRIVCSLVGEWIEKGEYPDNEDAVQLVKNISFYNAEKFFKR